MGTKKGQRRKTARRAYKTGRKAMQRRPIRVRRKTSLPGGWRKGDPYETVIPGQGVYQHTTKTAAQRQAKAAQRLKAAKRRRRK